MANERLRAALARDRWTVSRFADALSVDHKTVERWITKDRTPHRTTVIAAAKLLNEDPAYLWPDFGRRVVSDETHGEVITVYTARSSVPNSLWLSLLRAATDSIDILVYAGLHLPEANPSWPEFGSIANIMQISRRHQQVTIGRRNHMSDPACLLSDACHKIRVLRIMTPAAAFPG